MVLIFQIFFVMAAIQNGQQHDCWLKTITQGPLTQTKIFVFSKFSYVWFKGISHGLNLISHRIVFQILCGKKSSENQQKPGF